MIVIYFFNVGFEMLICKKKKQKTNKHLLSWQYRGKSMVNITIVLKCSISLFLNVVAAGTDRMR